MFTISGIGSLLSTMEVIYDKKVLVNVHEIDFFSCSGIRQVIYDKKVLVNVH